MKSKEYVITGAMLILITYTLSLSIVSQAFSADQTSKTLSNTGTIQATQGIGIYSNSECTSQLSSMTWGTLEPGTNQNITCYIKNEGNTNTLLYFQNSNWSPSNASDYLSLSWDYNGQTIDPDTAIQVTFSLSVSPEVMGITTFSFDITIIGSN